MTMRRLEGRVAIVTGASSGFGRATSIRLASEGARVLAADLDEAGGRETVGLVGQIGGESDLFIGDIATEAGASAVVKRTLDLFGTVDILVNNAGIAPEGADGRTWDVPEDSWDRLIRVNLKSIYLCTRAAVPTMIAKGKGAVVNVASIAATRTCSSAAYAAAKSGILGYTLQVASELGPLGVRINSVSPGFMVTPMSTGERRGLSAEESRARLEEMGRKSPMGRMGEADDIAAAIAYLASDDAKYVTGQELVVDGGYLVF
jgi:NAD(P)-dependent dehydrogenase (short-subunit alcohol dehydrogenase family)